MSGITKQQQLPARDGTVLVIDSWLKDEDTMIMEPGSSSATATCPVHGEISSGYVAFLVGFDLGDHANEHHGGLKMPKDLLETGPYIQL